MQAEKPKLHWRFIYTADLDFAPPDLEGKGVGGTEAALILVTRSLAARGHRVEVFVNTSSPSHYEGVDWHHLKDLRAASPTPDVTVALRFDSAVQNAPAGVQIFWMIDEQTAGVRRFLEVWGERSTVVTMSEAQRRILSQAGVKVASVDIPLPVETHRYTFTPSAQRQRACLYASVPDRGLDAVLAFWSLVHQAVPDVRLWVTSGFELWGWQGAEGLREQIIGRAACLRAALEESSTASVPDGVELLGVVSKSRLRGLQQQAWLGIYPCRYPEMFCLTAAEAAAAGTPIIASPIDALVERIEDGRTGILVPGKINDPRTLRNFAQQTIALLQNSQRRDELGRSAWLKAQSYSVDTVATRWEQLVWGLYSPKRST